MVDELQFVVFRVDSQQFAIAIHHVTEVVSYTPVTPVPGAPSFIEGILDLRGKLVPVIDLRKRLGIREISNSMQTRIVILRLHRQKIGFIVDAAEQVYTIPVENIQAPPDSAGFVLAVAKHENELLVILDLERLLTGKEQISLEKMKLPAPVKT